MKSTAIVFTIFLYLCTTTFGVSRDHLYLTSEEVPVLVNKIGPYSNPSESYDYYSLPLCEPPVKIKIRQNLGEKIEGDKTYNSPYLVNFTIPVRDRVVCTKTFRAEEIKRLIEAINQYYYFEFELDGIPLRGFIGNVVNEITATNEKIKHYYLFRHMHFSILYNEDAREDKKKGAGTVIYANITSDLDRMKELRIGTDNLEVTFTYSVSWEQTKVKFEDRINYWHDKFFLQSSLELEIHWLSVVNSLVLVILLTCFLGIIIARILRSDYTRYQSNTEDEDYGWKLVYGDVFRFPSYKFLLCSLLGVGSQFLLMMAFILGLAVLGLYYPGNEGNLQISAIVLYALTAGISGLVSNYLYKQMGGTRWAWNVIFTSSVYAVPFFLIALIINFVAVSWHVTQAFPVGVILPVLLIWGLVGFPLTLFGGITGKRIAGEFYAPVRTKNFPREIPTLPLYKRLPFQMMIAGFLPFSAIYIELFYMFNSVWGRSSYQLFGILCLVFFILLSVTASITVALTYFQLASEDYRWWWNSFLNGGSTGIFIYLYSIFYYFFRSDMTGLLQACFYFGYMFVVCYFFFIMLGTVGFFSSLFFVRYIFQNLHFD